MGYAGTAFCLNGWDKARLSLDSASAVVLVGTALTVYTIIAMSHPLLLRHSPTLATQPPSTAAQQKGAKKSNFVGSQVLPGGGKYIGSPHVRSRGLAGLEYDNKTRLGKHYPIRGGHQIIGLLQ